MSIDAATIEKMRLTYWELFNSNDPFAEVFTDKLSNRMILCPTDGYFLTEEQYMALLKTMKSLDEVSFFISEVEGESDFFNSPSHWRICVETSYEEYCQLPVCLENAIYSESGLWGLIISHEEHALFGGNQNAIRLFKDNLPNWEHGIAQFTRKWEYNQKEYGSKVDWIPRLMSHIQQNHA